MIKILIADDHALIRKGLKQIVDDSADMRVTGEAENGMQAIQMSLQNQYDMILLDISLPDKNGIDVLKQIKANCPNTPILMLSMHPEEQYAVRSMKAGAAGYLNKQSAPAQLLTAIRNVAIGRKYISTELAEQLANGLSEGYKELIHQTLSDREYQTLCLMASGKKLSEMAKIMSLSPKTVSVYRSRLLEKMKLKTNAEAIHYAISNHLIE
ncbi:response regulator [Sideroxydans lithotrophicus]|uniref:Two component transcriptional regulator, LuxR family n=1 Tax=Sideroxydans lithotrophicus (strain ES-1) TaxID=580332 RepID=D5CNE9_SIDLE|nr:response regulator transcription factor [Sideroxydans lithotrophicus]ADE10862.1 two component transcriptional regulator, LuxR family [Sideroxydans lithotrophicus ES-1]